MKTGEFLMKSDLRNFVVETTLRQTIHRQQTPNILKDTIYILDSDLDL